MRAMWQQWGGLIDPQTCDDIVEVALTKPPAFASVGLDNRVDPDYRDSEVRFLLREDRLDDGTEPWKDLYSTLDLYMRRANAAAFGVHLTMIRDLQFTTYREQRKQHFVWHRDTFWVNPHEACQRKLSAVLQLSDGADYDGGQFEMDVEQPPCPEAFKKKGSLLVFPSFAWHRVMPVTRGVRHSLVAWFDGPAWV
jgi:PKHD-type hydroxylase